jgi:isopentenyl-diphosphate delta-isomerase
MWPAPTRMSDIQKRKDEHLDLAARGDVGFHDTTTLFEDVRLVHDALPDLAFDEIDTSLTLLGKKLRAPIAIAGMTGGTDRARDINLQLAEIADRRGYVFGLGSQRAMLKDPNASPTYMVRTVAPNVLLLGNIGAVQAVQLTTEAVRALLDTVGADALCVHLNPAQELAQREGDRDFRGCLAAISRLTRELGRPVIVKETGCGISQHVGRRLYEAGIRHVDVSGAGGTSWVAVEAHRADAARREVAKTFWEWGIPTAASLVHVSALGFETVFASGGIATGLDVAKSIVLGASAAALARPVLKALDAGGRDGAEAFLDRIETELKTAMLLVGARDLATLREVPRVVTGRLLEWMR